jgi:energy-converting hydrogenase Eha subunit F
MGSYKLTELEAVQLAFSNPLKPPADDHADHPQTGPNSGNVTSSIQTLEQAVQRVDDKTGLQLCEG